MVHMQMERPRSNLHDLVFFLSYLSKSQLSCDMFQKSFGSYGWYSDGKHFSLRACLTLNPDDPFCATKNIISFLNEAKENKSLALGILPISFYLPAGLIH